jgi:hypothetical protein
MEDLDNFISSKVSEITDLVTSPLRAQIDTLAAELAEERLKVRELWEVVDLLLMVAAGADIPDEGSMTILKQAVDQARLLTESRVKNGMVSFANDLLAKMAKLQGVIL